MAVLRRMLCFVVLCCWSGAWAQTTVSGFSPDGQVRRVRQAVARFSQPMVAFGDLRAETPFDVDCAVPGSGRWVDAQTWSYDFERDLPGATNCRFALKPGVHDLAGQPLAGTRTFSVGTGGPAVLESRPGEGASGIDERQAFVLALSAPASSESIVKQAWCRADGVSDKIGVTLLQGEQREQVLRTDRWFVQRIVAEDRGKEETGPYTDARLRADDQAGRLARIVVLQCRRTLPSNADMALVWGAGVAAPNGVATAEEQTLSFKTRADFTARFVCEKVNARSQCIPFQPMRVDFSAPVRAADAAQIYLEGPGGKRWAARVDKEGGQAPDLVDQVSVPGPFPEQAKLTLHLPASLRDDAGRTLVNAGRFPLAVRTGEQPPLVKFAAPFGIIEANGDRLLPVTVRNVEAQLAGRMHTNGVAMRLDASRTADVLAWLRKVAGPHGGLNPSQPDGDQLKVSIFKGAKPDALQRFTLPRPLGRRAFEVIGIPLRQPGFYAVELESPRLGAALNPKGRAAYVRSAALVTNLAAHFKLGAQSSLVWVTSLDKGQPVAGARVEVRDCGARLLWSGTSDAAGIARIREALPHARCKEGDIYVVTAARGDDFTFTLSDWQQGIEAWRFNLPTGSRDEDSRVVATVFDRTLLRAGETVHMKHYLRRRTPQGFAFVRAKDPAPKEVRDWRAQELGTDRTALPARGFLVHQGSGEKIEFALRWAANGSAEGEWAIPTEAKLGVYDVLIGGQVAGDFRVEQFRVPTMKAQLAGPKQPSVAPQAVTLDAQVSYLSGGPAGLAPVKLRSVVQDTGVQFADHDEFTLGAGDVKEGVVDQGGESEDEAEPEGTPGQDVARTQSLQLDRAGGARIVVDRLPAIERPKSLLAELSYQDANGETLTVSTRVPLWPSAYVVGIKPDGWLLRRDALKFQVVVLDVAGKPAANVPVTVDLLKRVTYSHRRRLVGGFYAYEHSAEIKRVGEACSGTTDARGLLVCDTKAPVDGDLILRARATDAQQRVAATHREIYVAGDEEQWFANADHDRIDLLPAQKRYEPGEQARFQVRSPFRRATVLVTVEREGILDTYVRRLSGRDQTISIPVKANYAPNVFVSALVVRGRVAGVQPTALVDLGKPAYKLGIAPIRVGWKGHELKVDVAADKPVYKVREHAQVTVRVRGPDGTRPTAGTEVAVAAVDAGLLELMPNTSWNLLETMMHERSLQVETSTAQMQVVGKRHFGRKAFPHGGGGGRGAGRELFETLLLWKGKVVLDANGEATVDVPLNDSLTSFRIVAVASSGAGLFGTGGTDIRTSQDLMLVSGLPPQVREGDRLRAGFTLRNASDRQLAVRLDAGVTADGARAQALPRQDVALAPGESREVGWDTTVPAGASTLQWDVTAAGDGASDRMRVTQQVNVAVPVRTLQATLVQIDGTKTIPVERPADALPGRGGIRTTLQARLGSDLPGVRDYMTAYPYTCFEQRTSRAVALQDKAMWDKVVATLPAHLDGDGLVKYFAPMDQGSDVLTAYVLSVTHEAGYAIPDELRGRMEAGLAAFVEGKIVRGSGRATGELAVRKLAALEALSRDTEVQPAMLDSIEVQPNLWPTSAVIDWYLVLKRTPALPQREQRLAQAGQILRARLNLQGTTMGFSTERADGWWWLMTSVDVNANRLLLATLDDPAWKPDAGRLARGALGRQQHGHWDTTTANAWGTVALKRFSETYEREPVTGNANLVLAGSTDAKGVSWTGPVPASVLQAWPQGRGTLTMRQLGSGKPWATIQSLAAVPLKAPLSSGYRIARTVTPVEQKVKGTWSRGDVYRVHLDIDAQADMTWVVVDDPIPAGASVLGSGLGRDSQIATSGERRTGWTWPAFEERLHTGYRAYYEWVPKGRFTVEYTVRLNNEGRFALPSTRVEAMYAPEMFGEVPNAGVTVQ
jgi:alpha-2-macroglobulin